VPKSGIEHLAQHPGWKSKPRAKRETVKSGALESLKLKPYCQMCGARDSAPRRDKYGHWVVTQDPKLEPAFKPDGKAATLCQTCRMGSAEILASKRKREMILIFVEGGLVNGVVYPTRKPPTSVSYDVIDYDCLETDSNEDIAEYFAGRSETTREYMRKHLPDEYARFQVAIDATKSHPWVVNGLCKVCGHYGDDCTGTREKAGA
jgi:hypothetical protein